MVFFICEACGETLKKNKVDAHSWTCRGCWVLACMDCGKRFEGEAYKEHVSCMSEAQKYEGKLYQHKENKGEVKQKSWIEGVQQRLDSTPGEPCIRWCLGPECRADILSWTGFRWFAAAVVRGAIARLRERASEEAQVHQLCEELTQPEGASAVTGPACGAGFQA